MSEVMSKVEISTPTAAPPVSAWSLPNVLTYGRIVAVPEQASLFLAQVRAAARGFSSPERARVRALV